MSDLREPHERPDTCSAAELADILDRFIALPSTEAIFKAAAKKLRALSAEPAQEMTDEQRLSLLRHLRATHSSWAALPTHDGIWSDLTIDKHAVCSMLNTAIAELSADRASRLPEMGAGDWPELPSPANMSFIGTSRTPVPVFTAAQYRAAQVAAVEAYKALVRGKT